MLTAVVVVVDVVDDVGRVVLDLVVAVAVVARPAADRGVSAGRRALMESKAASLRTPFSRRASSS